MSLLAECSWRNVLGSGNAASLSLGIVQLSRLCPIPEMGSHGSSWVKDLVLHPSISQEQFADSPLCARYQDVIGPSERNKFIPKEWGSQSKYWKLSIHQTLVQSSLSGTMGRNSCYWWAHSAL